jgi:tripartite-type tricarboxylate transporter receptor subunit TctC
MFAPAATPPAVITRLNTAIVKVLAKPDVKKQISDQGAEVYTETPQQFAAFIQKESAKWSKVVKDSGASMD